MSEKITESEAIESLADELLNGEYADEATAQQTENPVEQGEAVANEATAEPSNAELMAELRALKEANTQPTKGEAGSETQTQAPLANLANKEALNELGLGEMAEQLQDNLNFIEQQKRALAEQQETARLTQVFQDNISKFKEAFPTIKVDELHSFIKENGYQDLLTENFKSWQLIGNAMINLAKNGEAPDRITTSGGIGGKKSAFDRLKSNDESVSDIELGAELLGL